MTILGISVCLLVLAVLVLLLVLVRIVGRNKTAHDAETGATLDSMLQLTHEKAKLEADCESMRVQLVEQKSQIALSVEELNEMRAKLSDAQVLLAKNEELQRQASEQLAERDERGKQLETDLQHLTARFNCVEIEKGKLETENKTLVQKQEEVKKEIENLQVQSKLQFEKIANEILEEKSTKFTETNRLNLKSILEPLDKSIGEFRQNINDNLSKETEQRTRVEEQIKNMMQQTTIVSEQANNLASALKTNNKTMGNWGESILEAILETSGLVRGTHYETQDGYIDDEGKRKIPDVVVYMPGAQSIVVDSKVSLVDYDRYFSSETEAEKKVCLAKHIASIRTHVDNLYSKNYAGKRKTLDVTMLFIPIEPAYMLAMQSDPDLWSYAFNKHIVIVSATNLITTLKIVSDLWRNDRQTKNAENIVEECERMYDKMIGFLETFEKIGKNINVAQNSYDQAFKQLKQGTGNLIGRTNKLVELGVKAKKQLPTSFDDYEE